MASYDVTQSRVTSDQTSKSIMQKRSKCHNCISNTAYQYLYVPFIQNSALI